MENSLRGEPGLIPCGCTEHPCSPAPRQTERYQVKSGVALCAACYTLGHMAAEPDPILRAYQDEVRRVARRTA